MKENQKIEWKQSWRDEYLKWICGFANAQGGTLVIGKNDRGEVLGITNAAKLLEEIPNKVRDILGMVVPVNLHNEAGKEWLEIVVEPYPSPISYKGEYHYRSGSTKQELKGAALDKLMIWNPGQLPPDWTVERLLSKHSSQPYNPDVANAFFRAGKIESWGRGIERIIDTCKAEGVPAPELRYEATGLWMVFHFATSQPKIGEAIGETTQETTQEKILALLRAQPSITRKELAILVGISSDGIKYHLEKMKSAGSIRHVGPTKAGLWEVLK